MTNYGPDDHVRHINGPELGEDGLVTGEIELPGGLPPESDEKDDDERFDVSRWDETLSIADRDGFVLFDPEAPGGFRALTPLERTELTDAVRAGSPSFVRDAPGPAGRIGADDDGGGRVDPRVTANGLPWVESKEGIAERERWAIENADPAKAFDDSHPDDPEALQRRLDDIRTRLTGYTWREGIDRDQALAERHAQLGRWYDDDAEDQTGEEVSSTDSDDNFSGRGECLIYPDDPRWYQ